MDIDIDKVFPLVDPSDTSAHWKMLWDAAHELVVAQQRKDFERIKPVLEALRSLLVLRESTEMTVEAAYYAMFKSDGEPYWHASWAALAALGVEVSV